VRFALPWHRESIFRESWSRHLLGHVTCSVWLGASESELLTRSCWLATAGSGLLDSAGATGSERRAQSCWHGQLAQSRVLGAARSEQRARNEWLERVIRSAKELVWSGKLPRRLYIRFSGSAHA